MTDIDVLTITQSLEKVVIDEFEELKKKANYTIVEKELMNYKTWKKEKKMVWKISRPFMWDCFQSKWNYLVPYLSKDYPCGDVFYGETDVMENTEENLALLRRWIANKCYRCGGNITWFEGDKRLSYCCLSCNDETPFCKGAWAYE